MNFEYFLTDESGYDREVDSWEEADACTAWGEADEETYERMYAWLDANRDSIYDYEYYVSDDNILTMTAYKTNK